ncbi:hypothetical protein KSC_069530 [Ktedonobacter sp. SOSP1-52]|nr:hypothetical protein KSC_069530 [Ktedonobacter sp. SOSP1-52]
MLSSHLLIFLKVSKGLMGIVGGPTQLALFQAYRTQQKGQGERRGEQTEAFRSPILFKKALAGHLHLACEKDF